MGAIVGTRRKACDEEVTHLEPGALHSEVEAHDPDATKLQVRAFLLQEANRGLKPCTRSTEPFALRRFYPFLIAEGISDEEPAALVTLTSSEVDLDARRISLVGKGRKPPVVPIPYLLADVRREYLDELRPRLSASPYLRADPGLRVGVGRAFSDPWRHSGRRRCRPLAKVSTRSMVLPAGAVLSRRTGMASDRLGIGTSWAVGTPSAEQARASRPGPAPPTQHFSTRCSNVRPPSGSWGRTESERRRSRRYWHS